MPNTPEWLQRARTGWTNTGQHRPPFATDPADGQESVWDYPRPPLVVSDERLVVIGDPHDPLATSNKAVRILETASPPTCYLPPGHVDLSRLEQTAGNSFCEWKGHARYWATTVDPSMPVGWDYPEPFPDFAAISGYFSFYPDRIECRVAGERVRAQAGGFYGGWITDEIVGPFKGDPGTSGW